ncbi:hypothetical protein ASG56_13105 [Rhodococcus sp. Leaf7]|uniref:N-acetylglutamate synthase, CG3035 family n=1 Tax=unclassified Rhodococcus (in: high G+C Gram-positive bacteria) TaxID=192944 RepID=UPI0006FEB63F|nr:MULTISPECIES: GNAT family N-acetyltransferase [unclassified Rhodococcus (in: high G+C Gram-positive bacteria)]KQU04313.1 hypothetical protein ASG56_13105 [Rhodococcus sp. Leaf7]KQU40498.1 hypothetical protein ASG64_13100 [Rhodococcus sp. Leaf247]
MADPAPGTRVVVRYRLPEGSTPPLTDVIGRLDAAGESLVVQPESGEAVTIPRDRVVVVKALAARPIRNSEIRNLESAAAHAWPGGEQEWLDGWLLRAADGLTLRGNSAVPVRPDASEASLPDIERWYRDRGLTPRLSLPDRVFRPPSGWTLTDAAVVLTRPLTDERAPSDAVAMATPDDRWLAHHPRYDAPAGVPLLTSVVDGVAAFLRLDDAATARVAVTSAPDGRRWAGITAVTTHPDRRRQGWARRICAEACAWGAENGATHGYVQVEESNAAALRLYDGLGFGEHHRYRYAEPGPSSS